MTARSTSRLRASCCCPCGLAPVVTVAAGTRWGDATPCYASHHMMLVLLLCVMYLDRQRYTVFWPYTICRPNTKTKTSRTRGHTTHRHTRTDFFFGMYKLETRFARIISHHRIRNPAICLQLQQTRGENGDPRGRYRLARCGNSNPTG